MLALAVLCIAPAGSPVAAQVIAERVALGPFAPDTPPPPEPAAGAAMPHRIGLPRTLAGLRSAEGLRARLRWTALPQGGEAAAVSITSPGAAALRLGLRVGTLPSAAVLRFYAPGDGASGAAVRGSEVLAVLARNAAADETGSEARTYWSPIVDGDTLVMEIELPAGVDAGSVLLAAPLVSHFTEAVPPASNERDGHGVAAYTSDGTSFACGGTFVPARPGMQARGYFLVASRCVSTQSAASSITVYWQGTREGTRGAALLYAARGDGVSLLDLDGPLPAHARFAPWPFVGAPRDPALEQWLGNGRIARADERRGPFSPP